MAGMVHIREVSPVQNKQQKVNMTDINDTQTSNGNK